MTKPNEQASTERQKPDEGRYTLRQAARAIARHTTEKVETLVAKLMKVAEDGTLPVYAPGENAQYRYGEGEGTILRRTTPDGLKRLEIHCIANYVMDNYEKAYWDDLNTWLNANEKRIAFRFSAPAESKPENEAEAQRRIAPSILEGEPPLKLDNNLRNNVKVWVQWQARKLKSPEDIGTTLAKKIRLLAEKRGYKSECKPLSIPTIITMLPVGITGGRGKTRTKPKK